MAEKSLFKKVKVIKVISETGDTKTFVLEPIDWQPDYKAGQFITFVFLHRGKEFRRSYSFSSSPLLNEPMSVTIKRIENGEFSRFMLSHVKEGDELITSGISGYFQLPGDLTNIGQLIFFAAGSGITPQYALIKTALAATSLPVTLIYSNRSVSDTIFFGDIIRLQEQYSGRLHTEFLYSTNIDIKHRRLSNWLLPQLLYPSLKVPLQECLFYLCGPFDYMQMISITLLTEGVIATNIKKENFNTLEPVRKAIPPDKEPHKVDIHFNERDYSLIVQYPDSILTQAKKQGIELPYSCEAGRCGSCSATCVKGEVWMAYNEVLLDDEISKGRVLTCQGFPVWGDVELRF